MATIREIAETCGVSAMTVSAVLNKRRGAASPETRARILRAVEEAGYRRGSNSRGARPERKNTLGVVLYCECDAIASDRYFGPILDGIFERATRHGQSTLIHVSEEAWELAVKKPLHFEDSCDGLIFMLPILPSESVVDLYKYHVPFVIVGESLTDASLSVVDLDNVAAGYDATNHLLEAGHRLIAHFGGDPNHISSAQREKGYRNALAEWGVPIDERLILPGKYNIPSGYRRMGELLAADLPNRPTAIFCADDWVALGAMQAIVESGRRIPEDFSLVGINNNKEGVSSQPPLTTINNPLRQVGQRAIDLLIAQIQNGAPAGEKALLRGDLVIRGSVSSPAGSRVAW